jgi:hypothetical protein
MKPPLPRWRTTPGPTPTFYQRFESAIALALTFVIAAVIVVGLYTEVRRKARAAGGDTETLAVNARGAIRSGSTRHAVRETAYPLAELAPHYDPLLRRVGDARFVLLGEASHGTHEFYRERARITKRDRGAWLHGGSRRG